MKRLNLNVLHWVKFLIKGLDESDKKEGLFKRLKNTEYKNQEQLKEIEYQGEGKLDMFDKQGKKQLNAIEKQKGATKKYQK